MPALLRWTMRLRMFEMTVSCDRNEQGAFQSTLKSNDFVTVATFCFRVDGESNLGPKTFEELCRAHIEAFAKGAQEYALSSQLTDRVNQWQERLAPILEEEERRAEFDIHAYASRIIELAQQEIIRNKVEPNSVCQISRFEQEIICDPSRSHALRIDSQHLCNILM